MGNKARAEHTAVNAWRVTVISDNELGSLEAAGLGALGTRLIQQLDQARREIDWRDGKLQKLTFEMAQLKRVKFGKKTEQLDAEQKALFDEAIDADIAAVEAQLKKLLDAKKPAAPKARPKRAALPPHLPRIDRHHEPESTVCSCGCALKRIGEDVSEKLDYTPGVFTVERHVRGKWACSRCRTVTQAPVPAEIIDKGMPTSGLLAQVLIAKHADHLPLYRQEAIFGRAGFSIPRSTLGAWVGQCGVRLQPLVDALKEHVMRCAVVQADETPVAMLAPSKGKTPTGPACGPTQLGRSRTCAQRSTTSQSVAPANMLGRSSATGAAARCATTTAPTRRASRSA